MRPLDDLLRRFRPIVAPPGRAGAGAVPVDRASELLAEIAGVLAAIELIEDDAERLGATSRAEAEARLEHGRAVAAQVITAARDQAPHERRAAYGERYRAGEVRIQRELEGAEREAQRIRRVARTRTPQLADAIVERIAAELRETVDVPP
jgi:hypothetical protein